MPTINEDEGILALCSFKNEYCCIEVRGTTSIVELHSQIRQRYPTCGSNPLFFKYKSPPNNTLVSLLVDNDVLFMVRLHREFKMNIIDMMATENREGVATEPSQNEMETNVPQTFGESVDGWIRAIHGEGQSFRDAKDFRSKLKRYSIAKRKSFKYVRNELKKVSVICSDEGCRWMICASYRRSDGAFAIRKCHLKHTCGESNLLTRGHPKADARLIAELVQPKVSVEPQYKPFTMKNDMLREYGVEIPYRRAWTGKEIALQKIHGLQKGSYERLRWFCNALRKTNPGSVAECELYDGTNKFRRMFICLHACAIGFVRGCRPLIFLDGTHIKNKHKGTLLSAVSKDADDGLFTLAYAGS